MIIYAVCYYSRGARFMQRLEGEFLRHSSKAEKIILTVSAVFVLLVVIYFLGQSCWKPAFTVTTEHQGSARTAVTQTAGETDAAKTTTADQSSDATNEKATDATSEKTTDAATELININTATAQELIALPGIGKTKAAAIVAYREEHGKFKTVDELTDVPGIGDSILAQVIQKITVGGG
jgi:comEA protein